MTKKGKEVTAVNEETSIVSAIAELSQKENFNAETFEKLIGLQREMKADQQREAYAEAFAKFQAECPIIKKTKKVSYSSTNYDYASLDEMVYTIKPILGKHGLSFAFDTRKEDSEMVLVTTVKHCKGHQESFEFFFSALDDGGKMNNSQRRKSAITYAKRSALENALGLVTAGEDDDARRAIENPATEEQLTKINSLLKSTDTPEGQFLNYLKIESLEMLSTADAKKALNLLNSKRNALVSKEAK